MVRRGEVWYAYLPGQPEDPHQPRPTLVISEDTRNRLTEDAIVVPIFSRGRPGPTHVLLVAGAGGLSHDSVLFCEELCTVDQQFLTRGPLGPPVPDAVLGRVLIAIRRALGEVIPDW